MIEYLTPVFFFLKTIVLSAGNPECWERLDGEFCGLLTNPLEASLAPFQSFLGIWFEVIFWALYIFIIWFRTQNNMLALILGIIVMSSISTIHANAVGIGLILGALALTIGIYQLYIQRSQYPIS